VERSYQTLTLPLLPLHVNPLKCTVLQVIASVPLRQFIRPSHESVAVLGTHPVLRNHPERESLLIALALIRERFVLPSRKESSSWVGYIESLPGVKETIESHPWYWPQELMNMLQDKNLEGNLVEHRRGIEAKYESVLLPLGSAFPQMLPLSIVSKDVWRWSLIMVVTR